MKAVIYRSYGPASVLALEEVKTPSAADLREGRLLVRVFAASLNPKDALVRKGKFKLLTGRRFPKRLGYDYTGEVVACGSATGSMRPGDKVFGMIQSWGAGACAEYVVARVNECARIAEKLPWASAAAIPLAAQTALQALRDIARVSAGTRVLINGASGGVGTFAIQIAKILGAHVTTVSSAGNAGLCRELGADETLDYLAAPVFAAAAYDVIFDVFGNRSLSEVRHALRRRGVYITTVPSRRAFFDTVVTWLASRRARLVAVRSKSDDLAYLSSLAGEGRLRAIVHKVFDLDEIQAACAQLESKHTRGKIVLRVADSS